MNTLGFDPGSDGAMAVISADRRRIKVYRFKDKSEKDIASMLHGELLEPCKAFLEKVHAMPGQGVTSMFTFGKNLGFLRGLLVGSGMPFEDVPPQTWQKKLSLGGSYENKAARKRAHKQQAEQWFPGIKVTLADADALLIAEYGHRVTYRG